MTEKQLWALIITVLKTGFTAAGFNATDPLAPAFVAIRQGAQPTITGRPDGMALLLYDQGGNRYGFVQRTDAVPALPAGVHTEAQKMESVYQVSALAPQDVTSPTWLTDPTARDLATRAAAVLQSSAAIATLQAAGVGIYRISAIRNVRFQNDQDAQESNPSFDFTLSWNLVDAAAVPGITPPIEPGIYPV